MKNKFLAFIAILVSSCFGLSADSAQSMTDEILCDMQQENPQEFYSYSYQPDVYYGYRYISLGTGPIILIPNIGLGYRERYAQLGWDSAIGFSTIGYIHQVTGQLNGHFYLNPHKQNSYYLGLGLLGSAIFTNHGDSIGTIAPDIVFGKELQKDENMRHFIELQLSMPTVSTNDHFHHIKWLPFFYVKYGFSF